jgi:hypothetical protein
MQGLIVCAVDMMMTLSNASIAMAVLTVLSMAGKLDVWMVSYRMRSFGRARWCEK